MSRRPRPSPRRSPGSSAGCCGKVSSISLATFRTRTSTCSLPAIACWCGRTCTRLCNICCWKRSAKFTRRWGRSIGSTGKLCCFQIVLCAQLGGDFLSQSLTSKGLCRRIHFRRMPSVNDGPSDMPDSGFAATSLLAGSPTSRIGLVFCSFSRLALGLDLLRSFAFCLCGSLHLRDPGSFSLCLLGRFALDLAGFSLCLLGRFALDLAGGFTLRLLRRLALRAFGSLDLRFLSGFALCLPRRLALGFSRSVALRLLGS